MASIDAEVVKHALQVARDHGFAEVEIANGEAQFRATLERVSAKPSAPTHAEPEPILAGDEVYIRANHVGYYRADGAKLEVGQSIEKGDVVATIAALGLANDLESPVSGVVTEVLAKEGDPVQYGQVLAKVKP
jgi:acetyl-CoA carboxylase biotin carboxyl carrier protein